MTTTIHTIGRGLYDAVLPSRPGHTWVWRGVRICRDDGAGWFWEEGEEEASWGCNRS